MVLSCLSKRVWFSESCQKNVRYTIPIDSQKFPICLPAQFIIWVTLFATTNSKSYYYYWSLRKNTYLCWELISYKKAVFNFNGSNHIFWHHHHLLLLMGHHHLLMALIGGLRVWLIQFMNLKICLLVALLHLLNLASTFLFFYLRKKLCISILTMILVWVKFIGLCLRWS